MSLPEGIPSPVNNQAHWCRAKGHPCQFVGFKAFDGRDRVDVLNGDTWMSAPPVRKWLVTQRELLYKVLIFHYTTYIINTYIYITYIINIYIYMLIFQIYVYIYTYIYCMYIYMYIYIYINCMYTYICIYIYTYYRNLYEFNNIYTQKHHPKTVFFPVQNRSFPFTMIRSRSSLIRHWRVSQGGFFSAGDAGDYHH